MIKSQLRRVTVTLPAGLTEKLTDLKADHQISVSSIVECVLLQYLEATSEEQLVRVLRDCGASLRRTHAEPMIQGRRRS